MSLYLEHFHLRELPFRITPAVTFFYRGCVRGETLSAIKYALSNGEGIITVVGEVGTGKSMLCRMLMTETADSVELVYIANPSLAQQEIVFHIAEELGLDVTAERHHITRNLQNRLLDLHAKGRHVLVCIDEAQAMPDESLEQIRLLSNLETSTDKIIQIIMFGQPELTGKLDQRHMRQLRERITSAFYLRKFNIEEVREYINHRLLSAGLADDTKLFATAATVVVAKISQGISRRINILCDKAMLAAFADDSPIVNASHVHKAAHDARYKRMDEDGYVEELASQRNRKTWLMAAAAAAAVLAIAYQTTSTNTAPVDANASAVATAATPSQTVAPLPASTPPPYILTSEPAPLHQPIRSTTDTTQRHDPVVAFVNNPQWTSFPTESYLRLRLNATQTLFGKPGDAEQYTARILTVPRERAIETERYLRDLARFFTIRNVQIYPAVAENKEVFVVTYGIFPSEFQAELFIHELPSFFRNNRPFTQAIAVSRFEAGSHW